jgi:energy-coupling factor transport system permease protein
MRPALSYRPGNSNLYRLNAYARLLWSLGAIVLCLIFNSPVYILILLVSVIIIINSAGLLKAWTTILKLGIWMGITIIIINMLVSYHGTHVLFTAPFQIPVLGTPVITLEAMAFGASMAVKLLIIISAMAFINYSVHPDDIMAVMLKMRLPYKSVLVTTLSTRYIPCLADDVSRIRDAYRTRRVNLDTGNWFKKVKNNSVIVMPLLYNSLERSVQVAEAMEARAFGSGKKRVFYHVIKSSAIDWIILACIGLPLILGIVIRVMGHGDYQYYPSFPEISMTPADIIWPLVLLLSLLLILPAAAIRRRIELD